MPMTGPQGQQEQPPTPGTPVLPRLQQMLDGFIKVDPPTTKQLPAEADVLEFLVQLGLSPQARELDCAIGDLTMINTVEQLKKIKLTIDDAGQYQHDDVIKQLKQLKQVAKEQFNPLDKTNGMSKLFEKTQNTINSITT